MGWLIQYACKLFVFQLVVNVTTLFKNLQVLIKYLEFKEKDNQHISLLMDS